MHRPRSRVCARAVVRDGTSWFWNMCSAGHISNAGNTVLTQRGSWAFLKKNSCPGDYQLRKFASLFANLIDLDQTSCNLPAHACVIEHCNNPWCSLAIPLSEGPWILIAADSVLPEISTFPVRKQLYPSVLFNPSVELCRPM